MNWRSGKSRRRWKSRWREEVEVEGGSRGGGRKSRWREEVEVEGGSRDKERKSRWRKEVKMVVRVK